MIFYGMRHYGPVDRIEGVGLIKTRFIHIWFIPVVPMGSTFVTRETEDGVYGVSVGLNARSVAVAWIRTLCVFGGIALTIGGVTSALLAAMTAFEAAKKGVHNGLAAVGSHEVLGVFGGIGMFVGAVLGVLFAVLLFWGVGHIFRDARGSRKAELMGQLGIAPGLDDPVA